MSSTDTTAYIPGTCNIGPEETKRRVRIGFVGMAIAILVVCIVEIMDVPRIYKLLVFPPVFYSLSGFIQARHRFCYVYGLKGVFSIAGRKQFKKVMEDEALKKDRQTALKIVVLTTAGAVVITGFYLLL